jgi:hypothetical protein
LNNSFQYFRESTVFNDMMAVAMASSSATRQPYVPCIGFKNLCACKDCRWRKRGGLHPNTSKEEMRWNKVVRVEMKKAGKKGYLGRLSEEDFIELMRQVVQQERRPSEILEEIHNDFLKEETYIELTNFETFFALHHFITVWETYHGYLDRDDPEREPMSSDEENEEFPQF